MSIDLDWCKLDSSISSKLVSILNRQLASTTRPSFIGPVEVTSLEFGSTSPDVELVDLADIYRDFMEDDEEEEDFEWVSRRGAHLSELYALHAPIPGPSMVDFRPGFSAWPAPVPRPPSRENTSFPSQATTIAPDPPNNHPNLQLHFNISWHSDLRITLTTSLLINYPSPMFMSLPIKLSVTGLIFTGQVAVAYEGEGRRVHLCILDEMDPYGPYPHPKRDSTPPDLDDPRPAKPPPVGQRLLPSIFIESEIGQADKHVLKNVTRVEQFIQDVIRKTVEEELVFPNFHTLIMGDP
ncbi:hypothetical protein BDZ89DRAFT_1064771 [Hymenopellis radicata]|nr:hypothetical protein BDZ89DRAFT_1064771 [Hymenopellis radicata]